ncbi:glycosyltransferase [Gammaproteobacteria bacterium LSUCC0112]|nr:glycosyltransferase [Gammaproteobacteria bacterium LSUCC0112]
MLSITANLMINDDVRVLFFAKSPIAGRVKTRFIPTLGVEGALGLHEQLIRLTWQRVTEGGKWPIELWMSESGQEHWFSQLCSPQQMYVQQGDDLGQRMYHALNDALQRAPNVLVIGADCVSLDDEYVSDAVSKLRAGARVVLGPAEDGGYVLLGVRNQVPAPLFEGIDWGTARVLDQTRVKLQQMLTDWQEMPTRWDVDVPEDLTRLERLLQSGNALTL